MGKFCNQSLAFMVLSRQLGTLKKTRLNHDDVYEITHMESHSNQKSVKQIKIYFVFEILQSSHPLP